MLILIPNVMRGNEGKFNAAPSDLVIAHKELSSSISLRGKTIKNNHDGERILLHLKS